MNVVHNSPRDAVMVMLRVISALTVRETHNRHGQLKIGYLWEIIEPVMFIFILTAIFAYARQINSGPMPPLLFYTTGYLPFMLFRDVMMRTTTAVKGNIQLLTFPQVQIFDLVIARALLEMANFIIVITILVSIIALLDLAELRLDDFLGMLLASFYLILLGLGSGMAFSALLPLFPSVEFVVSALLIRPLFFISGVFFYVDVIPYDLQAYALFNPILQLLEMFRSAFFLEYESSHFSIVYISTFTLCTLCLGLLLQRALRRFAGGLQ